jgi:hypothetical protein
MTMSLRRFLKKLHDAKIHFQLDQRRDDGISVIISVPGQRWEVDFRDDGTVYVERFVSNGETLGEDAFKELFEKFGDASAKGARASVKRQKRAAPASPVRSTIHKA